MSHVSTAVEYALHCLLYLVDLPDDVPSPSARDLAELRALPVKYVAGIMTKLNKAGIVVATEGVRGGIRLARAPEAISFLDVVIAVDGSKKLFECRDVRRDCALFQDGPPAWATTGVCSIHAVMIEAQARMHDVLRARTLRDMADAAATRIPAAFGDSVQSWLSDRARTRLSSPSTPS